MRFDLSPIVPVCAAFNTDISGEAGRRLEKYGEMLISYNEKVNLTAITDPEEIVYKHFLDCLLFFKHVDVKSGAAVIDVGTGAGFPGVVLKIARPDIELTLLDGLEKRLRFLSELLDSLGLSATLLHQRAEEGGRDPALREKYDIATARAVAALPALCELCVPFVKPGGLFVAMKGQNADAEAQSAKNAYALLGCEAPVIKKDCLAAGEERAFIIAKKISQTSPKYPRVFAKIKKSPL